MGWGPSSASFSASPPDTTPVSTRWRSRRCWPTRGWTWRSPGRSTPGSSPATWRVSACGWAPTTWPSWPRWPSRQRGVLRGGADRHVEDQAVEAGVEEPLRLLGHRLGVAPGGGRPAPLLGDAQRGRAPLGLVHGGVNHTTVLATAHPAG